MSSSIRNSLLVLVTTVAVGLAPVAVSHINDKEMAQSYRQSWFALVGMNFGPMVEMLKGNIPWNAEQMAAWGNDLGAIASMNTARGFPDGSEKGTTRAKPEIWENKADFEDKMQDMKTAVAALQIAAASGDKGDIAKNIAATGKSCKACHDEYKSKDYLY